MQCIQVASCILYYFNVLSLVPLQLYKRYPDLHVYAFGVLPCLDFNTAEACESFITRFVGCIVTPKFSQSICKFLMEEDVLEVEW